ncbi:unnamed protein product [marine sediment metagenome]|uniref:Uncharacterized protein n=1 Tax=marine sediment metagenome TaxID=412755 RepID=X1KXF0_9ZZZZ
MKTYDVTVVCKNCSRSFKFDIPFGISVKDYLEVPGVRCPECECEKVLMQPK